MNINGRDLQALVEDANPACTFCHGRAIVCGSTPGDFVPWGSTTTQLPDSYEEDLCGACPDLDLAGIELHGDRAATRLFEALEQEEWPHTVYELAHWGCLQCELVDLQELVYDCQLGICTGADQARGEAL